MNYAAKADGTLQKVGKTTNGDFGHWFNASGMAISYGNGSKVYAEFTKSTRSVVVGQFPDANANGTKRTIREALHYKAGNGKSATAYLVFNITFREGVTAHSHLTAIDYTEPLPSGVSAATLPSEATNQGCNAQSQAYDIQGRRIDPKSMAEGPHNSLYIVDGKKIATKF